VNWLLNRLRAALLEEDGQTIVLVAVGFVALLGAAGLAIDVGHMEVMQRQVQSAADASALAGALEITKCDGTTGCSAMTTAAKDAVTENGLTNSTLVTQCGSTAGDTLSVTVNNGPCAMGSSSADPHYLDSQYVEAVVRKVEPTIFADLLGIPSLTISARAEATVGNDPNCLDLTGTSGMTFQESGASLTLSCGIMINSNSTMALQADGGTISATAVSIDGGYQNYGATITPTPVTGVSAVPDPLSYLQPPTVGSCDYSSLYSVNTGSAMLNPGNYCGGIQLNGGSLTLSAGTYVLGGLGLQMNGGSISGTGVTLYFTAGSAQFNGAYAVDLVAPTTGSYAGILFYQSSTDSSTVQLNGGAGSVFQGAIYAPDACVQLNGANVAAYTIVDAQSAQMYGGSFKLGSDYSSLPGGSPTKALSAILVE
jgi:Flp pilus assembly protein TadG